MESGGVHIFVFRDCSNRCLIIKEDLAIPGADMALVKFERRLI
jgi:hypothetical protein